MKSAIMQPYFMPYIGYFQLINFVDKFIIYDDVNYIKRGWINRNRILINSEPSYISVPLVAVSQNKLIKDTLLNKEDATFKKLKRAVFFSYKAAPFFDEIYTLIDNILVFEEDIASFNTRLIKEVCKYLGIDTEIVESSRVYNNINLKGQERILDICKQENTVHYINPVGGMELYDQDYFISNRIQLSFIQSKKIEYKQFGNDFVPFLSIIDVMMFNHRDTVREMLGDFELI
ncbi:WbqC family protein [Parapedobacter sp. 10938]|uniref:WbqC family protein n=1 Tax=Parapedobacter flavus TaxID=3110225 RepID=UPI002DB9D1FE|nr:WbqC family protein [Parapedobacter sp. 10938]MEC3880159.1 WbqC family protein [Parapedobacter sp. 10938]